MIKKSDYCICDSKAIQKYIETEYQKYHPKTTFIPYGAYLQKANLTKEATDLMTKYQFTKNNYYLIVGRFIPENNYETIIKEFMKTNIKKDLIIICNLEQNKFYQQLKDKTHFENDKRIKFIGSVYDNETLKGLRANAYAYIHGHSAGGTNPSLLEAMSQTKINILYDVAYNKEVGENSCLYFTKEENNLKNLLIKVDKLNSKEITKYATLSKKRITDEYTWDKIVNQYKNLFNKLLK